MTEIEEIRAIARERLQIPGEPGRVNRKLVRALGDAGLIEKILPGTAQTLCRLREGLAMESTEAETALALQGLGAYPILTFGAKEVADEWVPRVVKGEAVPAFALTEPEAGSDAGSLATKAERDGSYYVLTGTKTLISNAPEADVYTVFARTGEGAGPKGISAFAVPGDASGLTGTRIDLIAPHAIGGLEFDGVRVPGSHMLGDPGTGFRVALDTLDLFRPSVGAFAVGMAQAALDAAVAHAEKRHTFGKPLRSQQAVSHLLAEMATRTHAARLVVYDAAAAYDQKRSNVRRSSAMAKLFATETAQFVVDAALQIHGGTGLVAGHLLEHLYREVRATRIYEGTSEIQREVIARDLYS